MCKIGLKHILDKKYIYIYMYECKICSFSLSDCISETLKTQFFRQGVPLHFDGYCRVRMA